MTVSLQSGRQKRESGRPRDGKALVHANVGSVRQFFANKVNSGLEDLIQETFSRCLEYCTVLRAYSGERHTKVASFHESLGYRKTNPLAPANRAGPRPAGVPEPAPRKAPKPALAYAMTPGTVQLLRGTT